MQVRVLFDQNKLGSIKKKTQIAGQQMRRPFAAAVAVACWELILHHSFSA